MKYAIVEMDGRQFWIQIGKYFDFHRIPTKLGKEITFHRVLLFKDNEYKKDYQLLIGEPYVKNFQIKGKILEHLRSKKTIVYKMQPKKKNRKKQGHRQELTRVLMNDLIFN